jgi:ApeA N-terminal domain 1
MLGLEELQQGLIGVWWLPNAEDVQVPGQLTWKNPDGARLKLLESLSEDPLAAHASTLPLTIFGEIEGTPVTLHNATSTSVSIKTGTHSSGTSQTFHATRLFVGAHFTTEDLQEVSEFQVSSRSLSSWQNRSGMTHEMTFNEPENQRRYSISGVPLEDVEVSLRQGIMLKLHHSLSMNMSSDGSNSIGETNSFTFSCSTGLPLDIYRNYASLLRDLLSIAAGRLVPSPAITVRILKSATNGSRARGIDMYEWGSDGFDLSKDIERWAFRLGDGLDIADLSKWLQMDQRTSSHIKRLLATRHSQGMYLEDKLQNVSAVLQGMGRDITGNDRKEMQPAFEAVFNFVDESLRTYIPSVFKWKKGLADRRNEISHHDAKATDLEFNTSLALYLSSYWLALFGCIRAMQLPASVSSLLAATGQAQHEATFAKSNLQTLPERV